jgi:hypothetical protein
MHYVLSSSRTVSIAGSALTMLFIPALPNARLTANTPAVLDTPCTTLTLPPKPSIRLRSSAREGRWSVVSKTTAPVESATTHRESPTFAMNTYGAVVVTNRGAVSVRLRGNVLSMPSRSVMGL